jgi:hypothetical protein
MNVWQPALFAATGTQTGFTNFPDEQVQSVINHLRNLNRDLICPEPLGRREIYRWRLRDDLAAPGCARPALAEFALLVEGILYGFLSTRTFDLSAYGFTYSADHDRYLTLLLFEQAPGAAPAVAGFFSPYTMICPAGNWRLRAELEQKIQDFRTTQDGLSARALLRTFRSQFPGVETLWGKAIDWLLNDLDAASIDPGESSQRNLGPFLLELSPGSPPQRVFLPAFARGYLPSLVRRLQGSVYADGLGGVSVLHNDHVVSEILTPKRNNRPALFGLGSVRWPLPEVSIPAQQTFGASPKEAFSSHLTSVIGAFGREGEGWKLPDAARRFRIPDSLRAVFHAMGPGAARAFLEGANARWLYSDEAHNCGFDPLPHESLADPGRTKTEAVDVFVSPVADDRVAYYIERWQGRDLGELTKLGHALWTIFSAKRHGEDAEAVSARLLEDKSGRISVKAQVSLIPPQKASDGLSWSDFLFWLDDQPDELFREAGRAFASRSQGEFPDWPRVRRTEVEQIEIHSHAWKVANA